MVLRGKGRREDEVKGIWEIGNSRGRGAVAGFRFSPERGREEWLFRVS